MASPGAAFSALGLQGDPALMASSQKRKPPSVGNGGAFTGASGLEQETRPADSNNAHPASPFQAYHSASRALIIAGLSGFFTLSQSRDGPDR
jgi:hypothetical protein